MVARELRDYLDQARREPTREHLEALWRAVFLLKAWYFVPSRTQEGPDMPLVAMVDGAPWLVACTNVRRLTEFSREQDRLGPTGEVFMLILDPLESMTHILAHRAHLAGVVFNPGSEETFRAPVHALEQYARIFGLPLP